MIAMGRGSLEGYYEALRSQKGKEDEDGGEGGGKGAGRWRLWSRWRIRSGGIGSLR
jgi:hypothetical protein